MILLINYQEVFNMTEYKCPSEIELEKKIDESLIEKEGGKR